MPYQVMHAAAPPNMPLLKRRGAFAPLCYAHPPSTHCVSAEPTALPRGDRVGPRSQATVERTLFSRKSGRWDANEKGRFVDVDKSPLRWKASSPHYPTAL